MIGKNIFGLGAIGAALSGCTPLSAQVPGPRAHATGPILVAMPAALTTVGFSICAGGVHKPANVGVIRIRLPKKLTIGRPLTRAVKFKRYDKGGFDPDLGEDQLDTKGEIKDVANSTTPAPQPYHIYLGQRQFPSTGFAVVRVIIPAGAAYRFHHEELSAADHAMGRYDIEGVGAGEPINDGALCGHVPIRTKAAKAHEIATFYVDLAKLTLMAQRTFNIILEPLGAEETLIVIDPKVHNDGLGTTVPAA